MYLLTPKGQLYIKKRINSFSIIELLLASSVFALLMTAFVGAYLYGEEATSLAGNRARAVLLAQEGLEAVQNIRDEDYLSLSDGTYGLNSAGGRWTLVGTQDVTDIFTRSISLVTSADLKKKNLTSAVTWQQNLQRTGNVTLVSKLTYWQKVGSTIGDWTNPNVKLGSFDSPGAQDALKLQIQGNFVYLIRAGGTEFDIYNVVNPLSPTLSASLLLNGVPQNIAVSGNYAYIASDDNSQELQIINISNPNSPSLIGSYNSIGSVNASGVYVVGNFVYLTFLNKTADPELEIINVTTPTSPTLVGALELGSASSGNEIIVLNNYAYLATSNSARELMIINVTNPALPVLTGYLNLASIARTIEVYANTAIVGAGNFIYTVNVTDPALPVSLGFYNVGGLTNDLSLGNSNSYIFIASANTTNDLTVLNISNPVAPALVGSFDSLGNMNGVAYGSTADKVFSATTANTEELLVIGP